LVTAIFQAFDGYNVIGERLEKFIKYVFDYIFINEKSKCYNTLIEILFKSISDRNKEK